jgi:phospholipid transport system substrate-binding protein
MRTRHLVHAFAVLLVTSAAAPSSATDPSGAPSAFVAELARKAFLSVDGGTPSSVDRRQLLQGLLDEDFDVPRIAGFVLGRHWQKASDAERQTFIAVFRDFMVRAYSHRFTEYSGRSLRVIGEQAQSATATVVYTEISQPSSGQPTKVEWRVIDRDGYRIIDISIAGVSMALAEREEFASSLQRNGGDLSNLIERLQLKMSEQQSR